jgi:thiol-disulfide isomerase/thioredoxin
MGLFDDVPQWVLIAGGVALGALIFYLIWKSMKSDKKHHKPVPDQPTEGEQPIGGQQPPPKAPTPPPSSGGVTLVLFHWINCGHCKTFMPEWESLKTTLKGKCDFEEHEYTQEPDVCKSAGVAAFPTLFIKSGGGMEKYQGPRTAKDIIQYLTTKGPSGSGPSQGQP